MNPSNGQVPLDYLDQIAPQAPKKPVFELNLKTVLFGGAILILLVIILSMAVGGLSGGKKAAWERLSARLDATAAIADDATSKLKSGQLRTSNTELKLFITNTKRDITDQLTTHKVDPEKISAKILAEESTEETLASLEDGRLNAKYDTTYAREMGYQLATLLALLSQLSSSSSGDTQVFLQTAYDNLSPTYEAIESFSTANE